MLLKTAATLLAWATYGIADIINYNFAEWNERGRTDDLWRFVTVCFHCLRQLTGALKLIALQRPDLTPPKLDITVYRKDKVAPGYIFVAPYDCLECSHTPTTEYVTQQIGPHIYSQDGVS